MRGVTDDELQAFVTQMRETVGVMSKQGAYHGKVLTGLLARIRALEMRVDALDATGRALEDEDGTKGGDLDPMTPRNQG